MQRICSESEASLDYYSLFKAIMKRTPIPMSPLESLASSAVRTAHKVCMLPPSLVTCTLILSGDFREMTQEDPFLINSNIIQSWERTV